MKKSYHLFCQELTDLIFNIIDQYGSLLVWKQSWQSQKNIQLPVGVSNYYHGGNLLYLLCLQVNKGYESNRWLTFNQIKRLSGSVQKGVKSSEVYFWKLQEEKAEEQKETVVSEIGQKNSEKKIAYF